MKYFINKELNLELNIRNIKEADDFIATNLAKAGISAVTSNECRIIFEELFSRVAVEDEEQDRTCCIEIKRRFGQVDICFSYRGERAVFDLDKTGFEDVGLTILSRYRDRLSFSYRRGLNTIGISIRESSVRKGIFYAASIVASAIIGIVLCSVLDKSQCQELVTTYITPLEHIFGNALMILSGPLVFLSMIRNITTVFSYSDHNLRISRTIIRVLLLSAYTAFAGLLAFTFLTKVILDGISPVGSDAKAEMDYSWLADFIEEVIPSNLISLFTSGTTVPLVLFGIVFAVAICCSGKYFDMLKEFFDAIYVVFSKMLSMLMVLLPLAMFLAQLNNMLMYGIGLSCQKIMVSILIGAVGIVILFIFMSLRIGLVGVSPFKVIDALKGATKTNLKINSTINAVPYNIRYCVKNVGIEVSRLETTLPIMAQISQSGNCFFLTLLPLFMLTWQGVVINLPVMLIIAFLSILLSIGAPGQPGTIMIGMIVMMGLMGLETDQYMYVLIYAEVLFGWAMTFFNTFGDLSDVTMMHLKDAKKEKRKTK